MIIKERRKKFVRETIDFFKSFVPLTIVMVNCCVPSLPTYRFRFRQLFHTRYRSSTRCRSLGPSTWYLAYSWHTMLLGPTRPVMGRSTKNNWRGNVGRRGPTTGSYQVPFTGSYCRHIGPRPTEALRCLSRAIGPSPTVCL